ncbi:IS30 family transposase [Levilactobacillus brevis]
MVTRANRLSFEGSSWHISHNKIYRRIEQDNLGVKRKSHGARGFARKLRHQKENRKVKGTINERRGRLNDVSSVHERPVSCENRSRFCRWDGDTIRGKVGRSVLVTLVDRRSRYLLSQRVPKVNAKDVLIFFILAYLSVFVRLHQTEELSSWGGREVGEELDIPVYFPDPHAPQQ